MPITERPEKNLREVQLHPWKVACDVSGCYYIVCADTYEQGEAKLASHRCPTIGPTHIGLAVSRTLLEEAWLKLDVTVTELQEGNYPEDEKIRLKGVCRGMTEIIALFMKPHFSEPDEIVREAMKRYKAKQAGENYETPGLGSRRMTMPASTVKNPQREARPAKPSHKLAEKEVAAVKFAMQSGMFTPEDVAKTYGISVAVVKEICGS